MEVLELRKIQSARPRRDHAKVVKRISMMRMSESPHVFLETSQPQTGSPGNTMAARRPSRVRKGQSGALPGHARHPRRCAGGRNCQCGNAQLGHGFSLVYCQAMAWRLPVSSSEERDSLPFAMGYCTQPLRAPAWRTHCPARTASCAFTVPCTAAAPLH